MEEKDDQQILGTWESKASVGYKLWNEATAQAKKLTILISQIVQHDNVHYDDNGRYSLAKEI